jgi:hypothetical protein
LTSYQISHLFRQAPVFVTQKSDFAAPSGGLLPYSNEDIFMPIAGAATIPETGAVYFADFGGLMMASPSNMRVPSWFIQVVFNLALFFFRSISDTSTCAVIVSPK